MLTASWPIRRQPLTSTHGHAVCPNTTRSFLTLLPLPCFPSHTSKNELNHGKGEKK